MTSLDPLAAASSGAVWILRASGSAARERALALSATHGARARPLVASVPPVDLRALEDAAARTSFAPLVRLASYVGLDARALVPGAREALALALLGSTDVELVEVAAEGPVGPPSTRAGPPPAPPSSDPSDPAPEGLGVRHAHHERGCRGAGVRLAIVEQGWDVTAPRLPRGRIRLLCNDVGGHRSHGAAVLAVSCAALDARGRCGLAPDLDEVLLAGESARAWPGLDLAADAIVAAAVALRPGDVLLLETQRDDGGLARPAEVSEPILHAIRLAVARGVVVVEAAGNGGGDLDGWTTSDGRRPFAPDVPGSVDSGAVLVGACGGGPAWTVGAADTRGGRLDVLAPGDGVEIPGKEGGGEGGGAGEGTWPRGGGAPRLTGTSAAAALVAGCVALLQSARRAAGAPPLTPLAVRARLRDPMRGTPVRGASRPCPDLARLLDG